MKESNILIFRIVVSGLLIFFGVFFWIVFGSTILNYGGEREIFIILFAVMIGGGIVLAIASLIDFSIKSNRRKKLNLMSHSDLNNMFECPQCGIRGAIHFIKLDKDQILIKQRCPTHGGRHFWIPVRLKEHSIPYFQNTIFMCFKCGQVATEASVKFSGSWAIVNLTCPNHGINIPTHKIWGTIYNEIIKDVGTNPQPT